MNTRAGERLLHGPLVAVLFAGSTVLFGCDGDVPSAPTVESLPRTADVVTITPSSGNPTCGSFDSQWQEIKLEGDELSPGSYTTQDGYLTFTIERIDKTSFDFVSNVGVDAIFVKGGPGGLLYEYSPEATEGTELTAMRDGKRYGISHVSVCYDVEFARISIGNDAVNEVGAPHTFEVIVEQKTDPADDWQPVEDGTSVNVLLEATNGASVVTLDDTCAASGTTDGACDVTFTSPTAGKITGHATAEPEVGGSPLSVATDGVAPNSGDAVKTFVDAAIQIAPNAVNGIGEGHVFTVQATYDDGTGQPGPVPDGTVIDVTLSAVDAIPSDIVNDCASGTAGGSCTVSFNSNAAGTITGHASMSLDVGGVTLERETDGIGSNSGDAEKTYVARSLAWNKVDDDGVPFGGATFEACRTDAWDSETATLTALPTPECLTVVDDTDGSAGPGPDMDPDPGDLELRDLYLGRYAVRETAGLPGYEPDPSVHVAVITTTSPVALLTTEYVNTFDASISIEPDDVNGIGEPHTFTVEARFDDGMGNDIPVPDGTIVAVTLTASGGAAVTSITDDCSTGTVGGICTVTFTSETAGMVTGHAAVTVSDGGPVIFVETDGVAPNSDDAEKTYVAGGITWSKVDASGAPFGGTTFRVCRTHDFVSDSQSMVALGAPVCLSVTDDVDDIAGPGPDMDASPGEFALGGLVLGRYTLRETASLPGFGPSATVQTVDVTTGAPEATASAAFVNLADAWIRIGPDGLNGIGESHTFTVEARWNDGTGTDVAVPDGSVVVVTLAGSDGANPTVLADSCATGTVGGLCTVTFASDTAGTVTGHAALTIAGPGPAVQVQTDGVAPNSGDAVKDYVAGSLAWLKTDKAGAPLGATTFEVCRTHAYDSSTATMTPLGSAECLGVLDDGDGVDGPGPDQNAVEGEFAVTGLLLGRYTVQEIAAPPGYELDPSIQTVDLTDETPVGLLTTFINSPEKTCGCNPYFWKKHWYYWNHWSDPIAAAAGFTTSSSFNDVIGLSWTESPFPNSTTMLDVLYGFTSGGAAKVARQGVAGLLNIAAGLSYSYTNDPAVLIEAMRTAFVTGVYEPLGTELENANGSHCPIW